MPYFSSVKRFRRKFGVVKNFPQPPNDQNGIPRERTCGIPNRRYIFCSSKISPGVSRAPNCFFFPKGVGTVVSGTTLKGVIRLNDTLMLGPDPLGHFQQIAVKSIHRKRMAVKEVRAGQTASFALKKVYQL